MNPSEINVALNQHDEAELHAAEEYGFGADEESEPDYQDESEEYNYEDY